MSDELLFLGKSIIGASRPFNSFQRIVALPSSDEQLVSNRRGWCIPYCRRVQSGDE